MNREILGENPRGIWWNLFKKKPKETSRGSFGEMPGYISGKKIQI